MYLHKTNGMAAGTTAGKTATEPPVRNAASKPPPSQAAKPSAPPAPVHSTAVLRSASALIAAAGLPADKLSASIISFARFFSLPIKPELMAAIRRQAMAQPSAAATPTDVVKYAAAENASARTAADAGTAAKIREALSLAAAAAESKGVELHPKGLETFAEAIDPDWQKRQDSGGHGQRGRRNKNRHQQEEENAPAKIAAAKVAAITAAGLKQMALESVEKNPLLAILNRLPGKNGGRWIVLPFSFEEGGLEFKVSLRILLETDQASDRAVCMALDIAETERHWLFALESANGLSAAGLPAKKLAVYLQPELPPKAVEPFINELSYLMGIPPARISIKNRTESFPCESNCGADLPRSINEAV
jgi:hypothetical protein